MNAFYNLLYNYISPVFGYIMLFFYAIVDKFNGSYGIAIILFTIFARLIMIPTTLSQQKGMAKQQRLAPKIRRLQERYAGDQQKLQQAMNELYEREGYNPMTAGCLPMLIQMPFIIGLFGVLYNPLRYAIGLDSAMSDNLIEIFGNMVNDGIIDIGKTNVERYYPLYIIHYFNDLKDYIVAKGITTVPADILQRIQVFVDADRFTFLGLSLGVKPEFKQFNRYWIIPILSGVTSLLTSVISQVQQKKVNPAAAKNPGNGCMMIFMPLMSVYFTFLFPCGIGVYWITSNLFAALQSVFLKKVSSPQKNIAILMLKESVQRRSRENSVKLMKK
ncbi:MAG: YidC/Oxa1 family membrane protein insertase [Clostridia bacterium]|nr:YidC/Oxa1 family membrane protein insertase [Clostridia bacterium]